MPFIFRYHAARCDWCGARPVVRWYLVIGNSRAACAKQP